jgi:hypothetical protein
VGEELSFLSFCNATTPAINLTKAGSGMSPCWSSQASGHNIRLLLIHGGRKREFGESTKKVLQKSVVVVVVDFYRDEKG